MLSEYFHETGTRRSYKSNLTIEYYFGIKVINGILVDHGVFKTCVESIGNFSNYSLVTNTVLKVDNGQNIAIFIVRTVLKWERPRMTIYTWSTVEGFGISVLSSAIDGFNYMHEQIRDAYYY